MDEKKKILVVEDDPLVQELLGEILTKAGYEVVRAGDGEEGILQATGRHSTPDLILTDIMMPQMDGYAMYLALQADRVTRRIPVIFITAKVAREDKALAFGLGAQRYLTKPFTMTQILDAVRSAFQDVEERDRLFSLNILTCSGDLKKTSVYSLVDLFYVNEWNGKVLVRSGEKGGVLRFDKGKLVETNVGRGNNWLALEEMLGWNEGTFEVEK